MEHAQQTMLGAVWAKAEAKRIESNQEYFLIGRFFPEIIF